MRGKKRFNKKGFLLGEVSVKLIIAILAILVLIVLGAKLFGMFSKENDVKIAEDNLDLIAEKITYLQSPEYTGDFLYVMVFPPEKFKWNLKVYGEGHFPVKQCDLKSFETCLCMCNNLDCSGLIACEGFEYEIDLDDYDEPITSPVVVTAPLSSGTITHKNTLKLLTSPFELKISQEKNEFDQEIIKIEKSDKNV